MKTPERVTLWIIIAVLSFAMFLNFALVVDLADDRRRTEFEVDKHRKVLHLHEEMYRLLLDAHATTTFMMVDLILDIAIPTPQEEEEPVTVSKKR